MRYGIFIALLLCANASHADVFTCQTPSGQTVYSDIPCNRGERIERISPSESVSDPVAAEQELARQKAYTAVQAAENARARAAAPGPASLPDNSGPPPTWPANTPLSPSSSYTGPPPNIR